MPARSAPRVIRFDALEFSPRFEYGQMAVVAETCGEREGSELGAGFVRLTAARIPWTLRYDEMLLVLEGVLRVHTGGQVHEIHARDSLWLPAGTELVYEADAALLSYAIHPANWSQAG